jgi:hypothetical protein
VGCLEQDGIGLVGDGVGLVGDGVGLVEYRGGLVGNEGGLVEDGAGLVGNRDGLVGDNVAKWKQKWYNERQRRLSGRSRWLSCICRGNVMGDRGGFLHTYEGLWDG